MGGISIKILFNNLCVLLVFAVLWNGAASEDKCAIGCQGNAQPAFLTGHTYSYNLEGVIAVYLTSADKQETSLSVQGQVAVSAIGNCAHVLRVKNIQISGPDGKKYGRPSGIEKPVRFTYQDGQVGSDICAEPGDNQRSLNIKRAIISLLQNGQKHNTQVDVFGVCPTDFMTSKEGGGLVVRRSRNLNRCAHREQGKSDLFTSIYDPNSEIKATHILQSSLSVEAKVKAGVPEKVAATEEYLYRPFSAGQNGARARVVTKLSLSGHSPGSDTGVFKAAKSIIFENPHPVNLEHENVAAVLLALKSAAQSLEASAGSKSASIFANLIKIFRVTSKADLLNVYGQIKAGGAVKDNNVAKKVFLDALLRTGTGDSIEVSIQLLQNKELSQLEQRLVFLSLSNARHASAQSIQAASLLLNTPDLPREVYLGVGALAGAYCREHACHGEQSPGIVALSQKLGAKLQGCKPKSRKDEDTIIAVLKGIRNIHHIEDSLVDKLAHCVADRDVKQRIKVAALEAIHADPCIPKLKKVALDALKNRQLDSEIRIKAYLALLDCPDGKVANELKSLLDSEPVNQVGRFITSSLRFIRASANPARESARQHFGLIKTPNKFNIDGRKYSFTNEFSYHIEALGIGAVVEENVIYSQNSWLPRSASLNLTAELFGQNVNILEVGARQGNLDRVVEHYFGPKGYFRTHNPQQIYDDILAKIEEFQQSVKHKLEGKRTKRDVQQEIANFAKQLKVESAGYDGDLDLDVYVKLFGTDSIFLSFGDDSSITLDNVIAKIFEQLETGIKNAKHFSTEFRQHLLFLDAELAYPTGLGIPLKLNLVGASTAKLTFGGSLDIKQIIQDPKNAKIEIQAIPSANIEVSGSLFADADLVSTGLKVVSNLHTSTGGHLIVKVLDNGQGFDLQLGLPVEKQEIVTVTNDIVFATQDKGQQENEVTLKFDVDRKDYSGCFDQLAGILGLTFCGEFNIPFAQTGPEAGASLQKLAAKYPLTGPSRVAIRLENNDLRGYHVKGLFSTKDPHRQNFELIFEAEGQKVSRKTALTGEYINTDQEKSVKLVLASPYKTLDGQVQYLNNNQEKSLSVKVHHDKDEYYGKVGFSVNGDQNRAVYTPLVQYQTPGENAKGIKVDGQILAEKLGGGRKYTFKDICVNLPNNEPVKVEGFVSQDSQGFSSDLKLSQGKQQGSLGSKVVLLEHGVKLEVDFANTMNDNFNFKLKYEGLKEEGHVLNDLVLYHGQGASDQNKIVFYQNLKYHIANIEDFDIITKNKLEVPVAAFKIKVEGEFNPKKAEIELEAKKDDIDLDFDFEGRRDSKKKGDYAVKVECAYKTTQGKRGIGILSKRDIVSEDKSNFQNIITLNPGGKYELSGVVNHRVKENDINVGAIGHMKVAGRNDEYKLDVGIVQSGQQINSHAKVSVGSTDFIDYTERYVSGANPNGQLKLILKDTLAVNGQFKMNGNDGKGNGVLIVDFKRLQRKFKVEANFLCHDPQFNADVNLYLNFEKDNANKICFNTNTKYAKGNIDSKNYLEVAGKKTELNIKRDSTTNQFEGKDVGSVEYVMPNGRILTFKYDRELVRNEEFYSGHQEVALTDGAQRGAPVSIIQYKGKLSNTDFKKYIINHEAQLHISTTQGKNLDVVGLLKNVPAGEGFNFDYKLDVNGNLIPKPASVLASVQVQYDGKNGQSKGRYKASYGNEYIIELNADEVFKNEETKSYEYKVDGRVVLPFEKAHDISFSSSDNIVIPKDPATAIEFTSSKSVKVNADAYKVNLNGKLGSHNGLVQVTGLVPQQDPLSVQLNYKTNRDGEKASGETGVKVTYGKGKVASLAIEGQRVGSQEVSGRLRAQLPDNEKVKNLDVKVNNKNKDNKSQYSQVIIDVDGKVYKSDFQVDLSKTTPLLDIKVTRPDKKQSRIYAKALLVSDQKLKLDLKVVDIEKFSLDLSIDSSFESIDSFVTKIDLDSSAFKFEKVHLDISSKDAKNGKRIQFNAKTGNDNLFSGSTSLLTKQEGTKTIIEGSGTVKFKNEEQKSATFKYIRSLLSEGNEHGVDVILNVGVGEKSFLFEQKATNLEYKISNEYCEVKQQCAHAYLTSKINIASPGSFQHHFQIQFDLSKLGFSPEFNLEVSTEASENKLPQFSLDIHLNQDQSKYQLHAYSQPKNGVFPSGFTLTLPHRVIALENSVVFHNEQNILFNFKGDVAFYLNKNSEPNQKLGIRIFSDLQEAGKLHYIAITEIGLSHPSIGREALMKVKGDFQKPGENVFKAQSSVSFAHPCLGQERQFKAAFDVNPHTIQISLKTPTVEVLNLVGKVSVAKDIQSGELDIVLLGDKPVQLRAEANNYRSVELTVHCKESNSKLVVLGHLDAERRVDISTDYYVNGQKKNLVHAGLFLENNKLKPDYGASIENLKFLGAQLKKESLEYGEHLKQLSEQAKAGADKDVAAITQELKKLSAYYQKEAEKIKTELLNDKTLQEINALTQDVIRTVAKVLSDIIDNATVIINKVTAFLKENYEKFSKVINEKVKPELKEVYDKFAEVFRQFAASIENALSYILAIGVDFFEKHKAEFQELANVFTEIFRDLTKILVARLKEIRAEVSQFTETLVENIKNLPVVTMLQEKFQEFSVPDQVFMALDELSNAIKSLLPTDESKSLVDVIFSYISKKLKQEKVNDEAELKLIYQKFASAFTSFINFLSGQVNEHGLQGLFNLNFIPFLPTSIEQVPVFGSVSVSLLNYLRTGELDSFQDLFRAYRIKSLNPLDILPPGKLQAVIVNGQHIFTFDGRHLTFPGNCKYVFARDAIDGNFTLAFNLQQGKAKSIILADKSGSVIEAKDNGQVFVNGANHGFPIIKAGIVAWKQLDGRIGLRSSYGVLAVCKPDLTLCTVDVSGFYSGKLRGLLGDGNNEPFDDFKLPNGKICIAEAEFGNSYRFPASCGQVKTVDHKHGHHGGNKHCDELFNSVYLKVCNPAIDPAPFRQACEHAVAGNQAQADRESCDIASAYVTLCKKTLIPALLPPRCAACKVGSDSYKLGEIFPATAPQKEADIVVVVELIKSSEQAYKELVVPLVSNIVDELKQKHVDDIKVYLVGVNPDIPHGIIYDIDSIKLKGAKIAFTAPSRFAEANSPIVTKNEKIDEYLANFSAYYRQIEIESGLNNIVAAGADLANVQFRPNAAKTIVALVAESCPYDGILPLIRAGILETALKAGGITYNLISPNPLKLPKGKGEHVIGFSDSSIYVLGDKKKGKDSGELLSTLEYKHDICFTYALRSHGNVFSSVNFLGLQGGQRKQFLSTASHVVVEGAVGVKYEQQCVCTLNEALQPHTQCTVESRNVIAKRKK